MRFNTCDMILTLFEINYEKEVWLSKYESTFKLDARQFMGDLKVTILKQFHCIMQHIVRKLKDPIMHS